MENTQTLSEPWNSNGISSSCGFCIWHKLVRMFQWKHIYYSQDTIEIYSALCVARKSQFYECSTRWFPHIFATDFIGISLHKIIGAHLIMISRHTRWRYFPTPLHPSIHTLCVVQQVAHAVRHLAFANALKWILPKDFGVILRNKDVMTNDCCISASSSANNKCLKYNAYVHFLSHLSFM